MKKWQKAVFIVVLTVFVGASVWMTFNSALATRLPRA